MYRTLFAFALAAAFSSSALAQAQIFVHATAEDVAGRRLVFELKEGIRRAAAMSLADRPEDARIAVQLVTLDPDSSTTGSGNRTIYSAVWTMKTFHDAPVDAYLTSYVGLCGLARVASCAQGMVAITDDQVTSLRRLLRDAMDARRN